MNDGEYSIRLIYGSIKSKTWAKALWIDRGMQVIDLGPTNFVEL